MAVREILSEAGTKFDPQVTEAFARLDHGTLVQPQPTRPTAVADASARRDPAADAGAAAA